MPVWARLITSISSGMVPQNGDATEHSCGGLAKLTGKRRVADPDDGEVPEHPCHLCGHAQCRIDADQVEDEFGALTLGDVLDALDRIVAGDQCLVGAHRLGDLQLVCRSIHRDNGCRRGERLEHLDGHLTQAACADDHRRRTRPQQMHRTLHRVIAGESRVGERRRLTGVQVAQRNQVARRRDEEIFGHAAVGAAQPARARLPDDYVVKPFSPAELVARVEAVLRRVSPSEEDEEMAPAIRRGPLRIEPAMRRVFLDDEELSLTQREFDLLAYLAARPGRVFSRDQLMAAVWEYPFFTDTSTVTVHIRRLRGKLSDDVAEPRFIETVWGVGYRFRA